MKNLLRILVMVTVFAVLLSACSGSAKPLSEVFSDIKAEVGVSEMIEFSSADDLTRFYGISSEDVSEFAGGINNSGVNQEEIVLVKSSGAEAADRVKTALENRLSSKLNETKNYNAEQYAIVEKCNVEVNDLYISLIISENAFAMKEIYHKAIG